MKKSILLLLSIAIIITGTIISIYNTPTQKSKNALKDVNGSNGYLSDDNQEYLNEIEHYKDEATSKIESNCQNIAAFKVKIDSQKEEIKEDYIQSVLELEIQNSNMKKKLDEYIPEGSDKWETFKTEFSNEMNELDKEFKDFTKVI